jgi:hypothetical protein
MSRRGVESSRFRVGACGSRSGRSVVAARANAAGAALDPGRVDADAPAALHVPAMPRNSARKAVSDAAGLLAG